MTRCTAAGAALTVVLGLGSVAPCPAADSCRDQLELFVTEVWRVHEQASRVGLPQAGEIAAAATDLEQALALSLIHI